MYTFVHTHFLVRLGTSMALLFHRSEVPGYRGTGVLGIVVVLKVYGYHITWMGCQYFIQRVGFPTP